MKYELVALRLREALSDNNMSRAELSRITGITEGSLSQYYNGIHCPNTMTSAKIANVLGVNPVWLMGFEAEKFQIESSKKGQQDAELLASFHKLTEANRQLILQMIQSLIGK